MEMFVYKIFLHSYGIGVFEFCEICNVLDRVQSRTLCLIDYTLHEYIKKKHHQRPLEK